MQEYALRTRHALGHPAGSAKEVARELEARGCRGKVWTTKKGVRHDGQKIDSQLIYRMLNNPLYVGRVPHRDTSYPGEHEAIIPQETWDAVHTMLKSNMNHDSTRRTPKINPFAGKVFCGACGGAMITFCLHFV